MFQIAIDGPSGAGKSTVAKMTAKRLGIVYVDTGALYRTVGYYVRSAGADPYTGAAVKALLPEIHVEVKFRDGKQTVYLNGEDLGDRIREPEISMYASAVSAHPSVRTFLLETQREIARTNNVIMDGRDIGTVILPDADVKIFMTADTEIRARRRFDELREKGKEVRYEDVLSEMIERDRNDAGRSVAPCKPAPDAVYFNNSDKNVEECVEEIIRISERVMGGKLPV